MFSPKTTEKLDGKVRERAIELVEAIQANGGGATEFMAEFAQQFQTSIFLELMGLPVEELPQFMEWENAILHASDDDLEARAAKRIAAMQAVMGRFASVIAERRAEPQDDITDEALNVFICARCIQPGWNRNRLRQRRVVRKRDDQR